MRKQKVVATSAQNDFVNLALESMEQTFSMIVMFIRLQIHFVVEYQPLCGV